MSMLNDDGQLIDRIGWRRILRGAAVAALLLAPNMTISAQVGRDTQAVAPVTAPEPPATGFVMVGGDTLFRLYGSLGPFSAAARATAVNARLVALRKDAGQERAAINVTDREGYSELSVGDAVVMTVLDADAAPVQATRTVLARTYAQSMQAALAADARSYGSRALLWGAALAVITTLTLVLLLWVMSWAFARLYRRIAALRNVRLPALRIQDFELLSAGRLSQLLNAVARVTRLVLTLLLFYIYVPLVLSYFPWTAPLSHTIVAYAVRPFAAAWASFVAYLPNLFYLAAGIIIVRYILKFVHALFGAIGAGTIRINGFHASWTEPSYKIVRAMVFAFAATALYPFLPGAGSDAFKGISIFIGVFFSLGSSASIGNMVAGVILTYTNAFQIGDRVQIGDVVGDVIEKTLLVTRLRTIKNVAVTFPNGAVLGGKVENFTTHAANHGLILHTTVTIGYDAPWKQVHELLLTAASRTEHVLSTPPSFVLQTSLDDFYVSYQLNAVTDRADRMAATYSQLHQNIQDSFNEGGVEIMSPHYATLRDGNQVTIPASYLPPDYQPPSFRVEQVHTGARAEPAG